MSWPLTLSVILTVAGEDLRLCLGGLGLVERGGGLAGQHGRGRREARPPQEVAAAVARGPALFALGSCSRISRFSLFFGAPRSPLPRGHAEHRPMQAESIAAVSTRARDPISK